MRYKQLISGAFLLWTCIACSGKKEQAATVAEAPPTPWDNYYIKGIRRGIRERRSAPFHQYRIQHEMDREKFCQ